MKKAITILLFLCFSVAVVICGCSAAYESIGYSSEEAALYAQRDQTLVNAAIQESVEQVIQKNLTDPTNLEKWKDTGNTVLWKGISAALALAGSITSAWLTKKISTANKVNVAMIKGVEQGNDSPTKEAIASIAMSAGVATVLDDKVQQLTR